MLDDDDKFIVVDTKLCVVIQTSKLILN